MGAGSHLLRRRDAIAELRRGQPDTATAGPTGPQPAVHQVAGQVLVAVGDVVPVVAFDRLLQIEAVLGGGGGVGLGGDQLPGHVVHGGEVGAAGADHLAVEVDVVGDGEGGRAGGPQQRRVGAADR